MDYERNDEYQEIKREQRSRDMPMIRVLDKGHVRLVDHMGNDLSIARSARVSYNAEWRTVLDGKSDRKLLKYLWTHKHTSPFESVEFQFEVKAPIFVVRQWVRHRTMGLEDCDGPGFDDTWWKQISLNEVSGRYTELPEEFYIPDPANVGTQSLDNKQARVPSGDSDRDFQCQYLRDACEEAFDAYHWLIQWGWPRELARSVLPLNTYTHLFVKVDLLNLLKFLRLRDAPGAQWEIQEYARAMKQLARVVVPVMMEIIDEEV